MLSGKELNQKSEGTGPAYQADSMHFHGLTYADTKQIALDLWKDNAIKMSEEAAQVAMRRINNFLDELIDRMSKRGDSSFNALREPGMQMALFAAQKEYVRSGDDTVGDILIDMLDQRASMLDRSLLQLSIDESIVAIGKLTIKQINIISLCGFFRSQKLLVFEEILKGLDKDKELPNVLKLAEEKAKEALFQLITVFEADKALSWYDYVHIATSNCGDVIMGTTHFVTLLINRMPGLFCKGFSIEEINKIGLSHFFDVSTYGNILVPCLHDSSLWQLAFIEDLNFFSWPKKTLDVSDFALVKSLMHEKEFSFDEGVSYLKTWGEPMLTFIEYWNTTGLKNLNLNNVGRLIGFINYARVFGIDLDFKGLL